MCQSKTAQRPPDRRQRARLHPAFDQRIPDLGQGNALPRGRQFAQHVLVVGQQRLAMPADLAWSVLPVSRTRRTSLIAADALTANRAAACRAELPSSTSPTNRFRRSLLESRPFYSTSFFARCFSGLTSFASRKVGIPFACGCSAGSPPTCRAPNPPCHRRFDARTLTGRR